MTTSASATTGASTLWMASGAGIAPSDVGGGSTERAPRDRICSRASSRMSNPSTTAPRRRAVATAWRPATPAPSTRTRAGFTVPAAVMRSGNIFGSRSAASRTAWKPITVAIDDRTSTAWARVLLGTRSSEIMSAPVGAKPAATSGCQTGSKRPTTTCDEPILDRRSSPGLLTDTTTVPSARSADGSEVTDAPAAL